MWKPLLGSKQYEINCKSGNVRTTSNQQDVGGDGQEKIDIVLESRSVIKHRIRTATLLNGYLFSYESPLLS